MTGQNQQMPDLFQLRTLLESLPDLSERERVLATELQERLRAQADLVSYASSIEIPDAPNNPDDTLHEKLHASRRDLGAHHRYWLTRIQLMLDGKLIAPDGSVGLRIVGLWPPTTGKSIYTSVILPSYLMGRFAKYKVMLTSYSDELPRQHGRRIRQICASEQFYRIFGVKLREDVTASDNFMLTNDSEYYGAGIQGGLTGRRAHGLIVDDVVKNREDADSLIIRDKTYGEYISSARTRKTPYQGNEPIEIVIGTRWHWDDLIGRILPEDYAGQSGFVKGRDTNWWFVVCLPMEAEHADDPIGRKPGEILWPQMPKNLAQEKVDTRHWNSLYQQRPSDEEGTYFRAEMLRPYDALPDISTMKIYGMSDYAVSEKQTADWTVHVIIGMDHAHQLWLLDLWRQQTTTDVWAAQQLRMMEEWKPLVWLEPKEVIQKGVLGFRNKLMRDFRVYCAFEEFANTGDKQMRARSMCGYMSIYGLHVPHLAPWFAKFKSELLSFPTGKNDDQVDAIALMGRIIDRALPGRLAPTESPTNKLLSTDPKQCTVTLDDLFAVSEQTNKETRGRMSGRRIH